MLLSTLALMLSPFLAPGPASHFEVAAVYAAGKAGRPGEVAVTFRGTDPDVRVNQTPAPRLALAEGAPLVLEKPAAPAKAAPGDASDEAKYLDAALPVSFPVTLAPGTARGTHPVKGTLTYFYCSKREGWCRKGTAPVEFEVRVP